MESACPPVRILAVDDEPFDLLLIERYLSRAGFEVARAGNGEQAWRMLHAPACKLPQAILLDRQMPVIDGIELLRLLTDDPALRDIPVIMQTGLAEPDQIAYGIACGARYYLAKPFTGELLVAMVRSAVNDYRLTRSLRDSASHFTAEQRFLRTAQFELQTLDEARALATHLAQFFPQPTRVVSGVVEILINAVEHGNLGLSYADKSALLKEAAWQDELERRLALPENRGKRVRAELQRLADRTVLTVTDEGAGFDWRPYLEIQPERVFDLHGRGIAMSRLMSFDEVNYRGCGNMVELIVVAQPDAGAGEAAAIAA
jgi:CheY-like chemotaxis protein